MKICQTLKEILKHNWIGQVAFHSQMHKMKQVVTIYFYWSKYCAFCWCDIWYLWDTKLSKCYLKLLNYQNLSHSVLGSSKESIPKMKLDIIVYRVDNSDIKIYNNTRQLQIRSYNSIQFKLHLSIALILVLQCYVAMISWYLVHACCVQSCRNFISKYCLIIKFYYVNIRVLKWHDSKSE